MGGRDQRRRRFASALLVITVVCAVSVVLAQEVTRGPYLQLGTPESIVVRWRTDSPTDSRVTYGPQADQLTWSVQDPLLTTEHAVILSGLTPSSTYYYAVGTSSATLAGGDSGHFFVTAPPAGTREATRIWAIGDAGEANPGAFAVRDAYYAHTAGTHTNLWLMLGDNANPSGTDDEYQTKVFEVYHEMLRKSVVWPTLGNHDAVSADSFLQTGPYYENFTLPDLGQAGGVISGTEAYYSFDYGNIHFVVLDSEDSPRHVGGSMLTWLEADLAATTQDWIIAFWHHPVYSKGGHDSDTELRQIEMRENALPIIDDYGVDLVLSGHSHSYERSFMIHGFYATPTVVPGDGVIVDGGDGRADGDGAYTKAERGAPWPALPGAVYTVAGSAAKTGGGSLDHPVMYVSYNLLGSLVLDVDGDRLDATFLGSDGAVLDYFTLYRGCANGDNDNDEVCNEDDNCPDDPNPDQADSDSDGIGDLCEDPDDFDGDGVLNNRDNCPDDPNPGQEDLDSDNFGDLCDNCPTIRNPAQKDLDQDGFGYPCDNCRNLYNPDQADSDSDGYGDACDPDGDSDGVDDDADNCPAQPNSNQADSDSDGLGDVCDNCPLTDNPVQEDADSDSVGDPCDNCPDDVNPNQLDADSNGIGDACDVGVDTDGDGVWDFYDCAPLTIGVAGLPDPIGNTLLMSKDGGASLQWEKGVQGHTTNLYRGELIPGVGLGDPTCLEAELVVTAAEDADLPPPGGAYYYVVAGCNVCGEGSAGRTSQGQERSPTWSVCPTVGGDFDTEGIPDLSDNCPMQANVSQADADQDFVGDVCDPLP